MFKGSGRWLVSMKFRSILLLSLIGTASFLPLTACDISKPSFCGPPPITVTPGESQAGQEIHISAGTSSCDLGYSASHQYKFSISGEKPAEGVSLGTSQISPDGSFNYTVLLPATLQNGSYSIVVTGSTLDSCSEENSQSCAMYTAQISIRNS